jgi:18S rRNA (guanine1575-N7)-methyltransferase
VKARRKRTREQTSKGGEIESEEETEVESERQSRIEIGSLKRKRYCTLSISAYIVLIEVKLYRRRGKESVPHDSKYTGRKRKAVF